MNMYFIKKKVLRFIFRAMKKTPLSMDMVKYWKTTDHVASKVIKDKHGALVMKMEGEKYEFPGYPRGHLLYGTLSKLKHEIKNRLFNDSWYMLEGGAPRTEVIAHFKKALRNINELAELSRYDMLPQEKLVMPVREIWRAWTVLEDRHPEYKEILEPLKKSLTYILAEDDAYRFRVQWIVQIFNPSAWWFKLFFRDPVRDFDLALQELEHAEVVGDMKERIRLLRRILLLILEDPKINGLFKELCREVDWNKVKISEVERYHFRGKFFKVDFEKFAY